MPHSISSIAPFKGFQTYPLILTHKTNGFSGSQKENSANLVLLTDSFLFLIVSMILIAASLYLPQHLAFLTNRAWFYYHGDEVAKGMAASFKSMDGTVTVTQTIAAVRETLASVAAKASGVPAREL
jgi:hypothetical protein